MPAPVVLVVGDAIAPTGFARVTQSILSRLHGRYTFYQLGINYFGGAHDEPWTIFPANRAGDVQGIAQLAEAVSTVQPDVILLVNDIWIVDKYLDALSTVSHRAKILAYVPVDADPLPLGSVRGLERLDCLVVYTDYAAHALSAAGAALRAREPSFRLPRTVVIPHGVDVKVFRPLFPLSGDLGEGRRAVRRALLPQDAAFEDSFIVLNANRNQPRKRIDVTVAGFAQFAGDKPANVRLYLHMGMSDLGWNIRELARRYGVGDRLIMSHAEAGPPDLSLGQLNQVYNACDVGINTAEGEGWGLTSFEHAATGAAQIVPGHSGPGSVWADAAELLTPAMRVTTPSTMADAQLIAPQTVAEALERLYRDRALLRRRSLAAYERAISPRYDWDAIAGSFDGLLAEFAPHPRDVDPAVGGPPWPAPLAPAFISGNAGIGHHLPARRTP